MPTVPDSFYINLTTVKGVCRTTAEFQHLLNPPSVLAARGITITDTQRYQLLREVAKALAFLHRVGVCVGDISPKNLLFSLHPRPAVYFIDCDAMRVNDVSVLPQVETPEWEVPTGEPLATVQSDTYKLGLLALRLLTGDQHTKDVQQLPSTTPKLLRQLITDTLTSNPDRRPLPESWTYLLGHTAEEAQHRAPTPSPPKPAPLSHSPEPQPVVRSRPTTTPAGKRVAAKVSTSATPASAPTGTSSIPKSARTILGVAAAGFLIIAIVVILGIIGSRSGSNDTGSVIEAAQVGDCLDVVTDYARTNADRSHPITVSKATCGTSYATDRVTLRTTDPGNCPSILTGWVRSESHSPPVVLCLEKAV
jgi:serine/threonine protein kinase